MQSGPQIIKICANKIGNKKPFKQNSNHLDKQRVAWAEKKKISNQIGEPFKKSMLFEMSPMNVKSAIMCKRQIRSSMYQL